MDLDSPKCVFHFVYLLKFELSLLPVSTGQAMQQHPRVGNNVSPHLQDRQNAEGCVCTEHPQVVPCSRAVLQSTKEVRHNKYTFCFAMSHSQFLHCADQAAMTLHKNLGSLFFFSKIIYSLSLFLQGSFSRRCPGGRMWREEWMCHGFENLHHLFLKFFPAALHLLCPQQSLDSNDAELRSPQDSQRQWGGLTYPFIPMAGHTNVVSHQFLTLTPLLFQPAFRSGLSGLFPVLPVLLP